MVERQYYFDANALFKYYHDEKGDLKIRRLVAIVTFLCFCTIVCQINILVGVQALAWFCQTKVWTPIF
jgi:hypothetical protein